MKIGIDKWHVDYQCSFNYEIVNAPDLLNPQNNTLLSIGRVENACRFVVIDNNVEKYYSAELRNYFLHHQVEAKIIPFSGGEENKTVEKYLSILNELDSFPILRRDEPIIAIGGGVLTDVVGFVASSYRRGVPHINVPTTLMGYIDASVGIKTGINFNGYKNRLGSFAPPLRVFLDRSFLKTLPRRHILNGVCEIIKLAIIKDLELFTLLELHGVQSVAMHFQDDLSGSILDRAVNGMIEEIQPNLLEEDLARKMDFGHTFCYGLETRHKAYLLHGEAVVLDIALSVLIARGRNLLSDQETCRIFALIEKLGIVLDTDILDPDLLWECLVERVRHRNGLQRVPLPDGMGSCVFVNDVKLNEIQSVVKKLKNQMVIKHDGIHGRR
jgi:3-dehydroquinate synthetase